MTQLPDPQTTSSSTLTPEDAFREYRTKVMAARAERVWRSYWVAEKTHGLSAPGASKRPVPPTKHSLEYPIQRAFEKLYGRIRHTRWHPVPPPSPTDSFWFRVIATRVDGRQFEVTVRPSTSKFGQVFFTVRLKPL